ncbi:uncharacterized protein LOC125287899 [Alosa alosa]|uniref:uncharacterized protein LOC125287899 n=1 Tax=Alosa alosa TaxID=278164 RepID=UPI002015508D|nr:uncharacterized protein LOC125287899 [Alosa alosa]
MLFIDFSSAFNTVIPSKLISKLGQLGISNSLCNWIIDFLTNIPQTLKLGSLSSSTITLNNDVPQGCVLSPLLYSPFTHDCAPVYDSNAITKFADDTTVVGLIREEVQHLAMWCKNNNLALNTQKTKEIIVDFRRAKSRAHIPLHISGINSGSRTPPPTWDVLPQNKVVNGLCEVGYICDVQYRDETSPAKIIQKVFSIREPSIRALEALERGCRNAATGTEECGCGLREKRPPAQFSPANGEDEEDTNPKLKGKKNLTKALSLPFLNEYEESEPGYSRDVNPAADSSIANQLNEMRCLLLEMREKIINLERTVRDQITQPASSTLSRSPLLPSSSSPSPPSRTTSSTSPPSPSPVQIHIGPTVKITATQYAHIKWSDPSKGHQGLVDGSVWEAGPGHTFIYGEAV